MTGIYTTIHPLHSETQVDIMRLASSIYIRNFDVGPSKSFLLMWKMLANNTKIFPKHGLGDSVPVRKLHACC